CGAPADNTTTTTNTKTTTTNTSGNTNTTTTTTTTTNTANTASTTTTAAVTGVAECDEYISKYEACVKDKVPANMRAQMQTTLDASRNAWKTAASTPQGKATLAKTCTDALAAAKQAMGSYGCNF
ncbi:MAG TPA: hypothetical protein VE360_10830, partial [Pyrinomonadaceae bacterium]|nr:hypothetical protein [Pyrinomonadaceae bacterium]